MAVKTLVIQNLQGIGDTLWFVPHMQALSKARGGVSLLTRPRSMADQILKADPFVEKVLWLKVKPGPHEGLLGTLRLAQLIRSQGFEEVWILHSRSLRYAVACRLAGVKRIYGPGVGLQRFFLSKGPMLPKEDQKKHPAQRGTLLLKAHGIPLEQSGAPLFLEGGAALSKKYQHCPKPWIGLGIASSEPHKKWPAERFIELGAALSKRGTVFIVGGPQESSEAYHIHHRLKAQGVEAIPVVDLAIGDTLALLSQLSFMVGNDTGILHAAPMAGSRGLVLLGHLQVPIHEHTRVEGLQAPKSQSTENNVGDLTALQVMDKLQHLGWV